MNEVANNPEQLRITLLILLFAVGFLMGKVR